MLPLTAPRLVAPIPVPLPQGYLDDFAEVLDAASGGHMSAVIIEVRETTRGEIAGVTLSDIDERPVAEVKGFLRARSVLPIGRLSRADLVTLAGGLGEGKWWRRIPSRSPTRVVPPSRKT